MTGLRDALAGITGTSWLDDAARQSLRAAIVKFDRPPADEMCIYPWCDGRSCQDCIDSER